MGITYQLMLFDEFNWDYVGKTKESSIKQFMEEYSSTGYVITKEAEWPYFVVFDVDKMWPKTEARLAIIKKYSDTAWFNMDISMWNWEKID